MHQATRFSWAKSLAGGLSCAVAGEACKASAPRAMPTPRQIVVGYFTASSLQGFRRGTSHYVHGSERGLQGRHSPGEGAMRAIFCVLVLALSSVAAGATRVDLVIDEPFADRQVPWPITTGVPFPRGQLADRRALPPARRHGGRAAAASSRGGDLGCRAKKRAVADDRLHRPAGTKICPGVRQRGAAEGVADAACGWQRRSCCRAIGGSLFRRRPLGAENDRGRSRPGWPDRAGRSRRRRSRQRRALLRRPGRRGGSPAAATARTARLWWSPAARCGPACAWMASIPGRAASGLPSIGRGITSSRACR